MAAGTGVQHSEFNPSSDEAVHFLQIWIQPDRKGLEPRYADRSIANAPEGKLNLVASRTGRDGSFAINQDTDPYLAKLGTGDRTSFELKPERHAWLHVAEGEIKVNGDVLKSGDAAAVSGETTLEIAAAKGSQVLLFDLN